MPKPNEGILSKFRIFETDEFLKKLKGLPSSDASLIRKKLDEYVYPQLREEPFFGTNIKKLRAYSTDIWRYRIGRFRVFYTVDQDEDVIFVLTVDLRRDTYR